MYPSARLRPEVLVEITKQSQKLGHQKLPGVWQALGDQVKSEATGKDHLISASLSSSPVSRIWPTTLNVGLQSEGKSLLQLVYHAALYHARAI